MNFITFNVIVLLPAVLYLFYLNHRSGKKILLDGLILGLFGNLCFDTFAHNSKAWFSPSIFSFRIIGAPIENFIWGVLFVLLVFGFYEYFFDSSHGTKLPPEHRYWVVVVVIVTMLFPIMYALNPKIFIIPSFYLLSIAVLLVVDFFILKGHPKFATKAILATVALLPLSFVHEFVSLELHYWIFEFGNHLAYVNLFGYIIPFEELMFFIGAPLATICIYELFIDNKKG